MVDFVMGVKTVKIDEIAKNEANNKKKNEQQPPHIATLITNQFSSQ